ncbi:MAG: response regulator [Ferruginibacter sp.]|nr:response regulator [Ferruginibacter sp.]
MNSIELLLIEDNEGDILLITEALNNESLLKKINIARDGQLAIDYLTNTLKVSEGELPNIILLDINLPKKNGQEVLHFIKNNDKLKHIPVIMLTTSSAPADILASYKNYANSFVTKPTDGTNFVELISKIEEYWLNLTHIPTHKS